MLNNLFHFGSRTYIMGILNITPDSFSDGGEYVYTDAAISHALNMLAEGADIIDIGGESSRPGHTQISIDEELSRVIPIIRNLRNKTDAIISLDTRNGEVAEEGIKNGVNILNDIWGLQGDPEMAKVAAKYNVPIIIMHNQNGTDYKMDIILEMIDFFKKSIKIAIDAGINSDNIILDPGIGFGKTVEQNIEVLSRLQEFKKLKYPILLGTSKKSTIGKILDLPPNERVEGTIATTVLGINQGIDIVRVHDVKENLRAAKVADAIVRSNYNG
ncbi:dihydropteroate synthase [Tissierella pigra]|uniref:Dihydropteroate synthase n=1 Tax=Tissierella pigra TaxID=2607614 RepID=A0A6N7XWP5_9FIRM|nr:dihydropteroate synthase [Tissierella pigra]MBU5425539.1 dihydropteroate synthase [Tissierella pigra]MSU00905.1 dihydropteroate synthase [Tissierella pigra]